VNFLLIINTRSVFGRISYRFRNIDAFNSKIVFWWAITDLV